MSSSTSVYVQDKKHGWVPGDVISSDDTTAKVRVYIPQAEEGKHSTDEITVKLASYQGGTLPLQNVNENGNLIEMADLCDLPFLHEPAILYNVKARHGDRKPYTRVGEIIIACNPFQWIEGLYEDEIREKYANNIIWNPSKSGDIRAGIDPHVYETSSLAYRGLAVDNQDQSILVSGESGAGKTETVKIVMSQLASVQSSSESPPAGGAAAQPDDQSNVVKRVLDSNPLLEAFGNAKTVRNDNSSRFGKYIQLQFDVEDATTAAYSGKSVPSCLLAGSVCETYLLEKSRVVMHDATERTYHIFYQLLDAPSDVKKEIWEPLENAHFSSFRYVGDTDTLLIEGKTDAQKWERTKNALELVGVSGDSLRMLMRAVATVLQLGNMTFDQDPDNDDGSVISSPDDLNKLADLMGVPLDDAKIALTTRTVVAGKEQYKVPLKVVDARDSCDAFAKEIFQQIFDWLVKAINAATCAESNYQYAKDVDDYGIIGLLDIFGFESFKVNRFEQLCINYANEKLQQKYTVDVFQSVKDEYDFEGIELADVAFSDNTEVLNLVEGRMGIIAVLNEECRRPKGNDNAFVSKVKSMNSDLSCLIAARLHRPNEFAIEHYAGPVKYDATNFVQKNNDTIPNDLLECASKSTNDLISTEVKAAAEAKGSGGGGKGKGKALTVSTKFRHQLTSLMHNISKTRTRYIRCLKPNPEKVPLKMNLTSSMEQLRCAGVIAAVTISRMAFPNRLMHETAIERFRCLSSMELIHDVDEKKEEVVDGSGHRDSIEMLFTELLKNMEETNEDGELVKAYVCGKTRVYFRSGAVEYLEAERLIALGILATSIQRMVRGWVAWYKYCTLKETAISCQAMARRTIARNYLLRVIESQTILACWTRCRIAKAELQWLKEKKASTLIQSCWRMSQAKKHLKTCINSAILIEKIARGAIQRPRYKTMKAEAEAEARMNSKLAALQKRLADTEMKWLQADKARIEAEKKAAGMVPAGEAPVGEVSAGAVTAVALGEGEQIMTAQQQALIDESGKMLEYLRNEVLKNRSKNYQLSTELAKLKESNLYLADHYASVTASYEALKQHATQLSTMNMKLKVEAAAQKDALTSYKRDSKTQQYSHRSEALKMKEEWRRKEMAQNDEIARLKEELENAKRDRLSVKQPAASKSTSLSRAEDSSLQYRLHGKKPSSLKKYLNYQTSSFVDPEEFWDHDGYFSRGGDGYSRDGYSRDGYSRDGYSRDGYSRDSYSQRGGYKRRGRNFWASEYSSPSKEKSVQKSKSQQFYHRRKAKKGSKQLDTKPKTSLASAATPPTSKLTKGSSKSSLSVATTKSSLGQAKTPKSTSSLSKATSPSGGLKTTPAGKKSSSGAKTTPSDKKPSSLAKVASSEKKTSSLAKAKSSKVEASSSLSKATKK